MDEQTRITPQDVRDAWAAYQADCAEHKTAAPPTGTLAAYWKLVRKAGTQGRWA